MASLNFRSLNLMTLAAAILIAPGLFTDITTDELWNWRLVETVGSPLGIFKLSGIDNNHLIISLYMWALKSSASPLTIRLFSFICGLFTIFIVGTLALRLGGTLATCLFSLFTAFPMLHYASEARGYAPLMLAVTGVYWHVLNNSPREDTRRQLVLAVTLLFGILSHLTFFTVLLPITAIELARILKSRSLTPLRTFFLIAPALAAGAILFHVAQSPTQYGGPQFSPEQSLADLFTLFTGTLTDDVQVILAIIPLTLFSLGVRAAARSYRAMLLLFFVSTLLLLLTILLSPYLTPNRTLLCYPRYFLALFPGFLVFLVLGFIDLQRRFLAASHMAIAGTFTILMLNWLPFVRFGRGQMSLIVKTIASEPSAPDEIVWGDHDSRVGDLFSFYLPRENLRNVHFVEIEKRKLAIAPHWFIEHAVRQDQVAQQEVKTTANGWRFRAQRNGQNGSPSGLWFRLYRYEAEKK